MTIRDVEEAVTTVSESRRRILQAVSECIADLGIQGATVRRIAKAAGVSTGAVAYYFANKKELIAAAVGEAAQSFNKQLNERAGEKFGPERLQAVAELLLGGSDAAVPPMSFWLEIWASATRDPELRQVYVEAFDRNSDYYRRSVDVGALSGDLHQGVTPEIAVGLISAMFAGLRLEAALAPQRVTPSVAVEVASLVLALLFPPNENAKES